MITKTTLRTVIADQTKELNTPQTTIPRTINQKAYTYIGSSALVIKGIRRCGKSTLLKQLLKTRYNNDFHYFNFDDERVADFKSEDFQTLMETLIETQGERKNLFFDEIQNISGWELFINRILRQGYRVYITGSNANLLSKELGTHLTGRHVDLELYPFSFTEALQIDNKTAEKGPYTTEQRAQLTRKFTEYLTHGGMPEAIIYKNETILTNILNDIIQKDISKRYQMRKISELKTVIKFLIANTSNPITFRSITHNFELKSPNTVQKYIEYAEETYLIFTTTRFEKKLKKRDKNPRKIYCIDNGIITQNTPSITEHRSALLENAVAIHLKRLGEEFYYFKGKTNAEADFVIPQKRKAIQVCYELNQNNQTRELKGLLEAADEIDADQRLILTLDQEDELNYRGKNVTVKPTWQWLLENEQNLS